MRSDLTMRLGIGLLGFALMGCAAGKEAAPPAAPMAPRGENRVSEMAHTVSGATTSESVTVAGFASDNLQADGAKKEPAPDAPPPPPPPPPQPGGQAPPTKQEKREQQASANGPHERGMLIYTAKITMSVYQVEQGLGKVEDIAKSMGGYLSLRHDRDVTVRVPRDRFESALAAIDKIGDVLHRDVQAQDVTDEFVDLEIRIKNGHAMQTRLKALLDKAPVKEAIEIEKELKRVTEELELLEGKMKLLSAQIAYSTITVTFEPRQSAVATSKVQLPFPWLSALGLPSLLRLSEDK